MKVTGVLQCRGLWHCLIIFPWVASENEYFRQAMLFHGNVLLCTSSDIYPSERAHREIHSLHDSYHIFWIILRQTSSIIDRYLHSTIHSTNIQDYSCDKHYEWVWTSTNSYSSEVHVFTSFLEEKSYRVSHNFCL